jgi:hypothetical protein
MTIETKEKEKGKIEASAKFDEKGNAVSSVKKTEEVSEKKKEQEIPTPEPVGSLLLPSKFQLYGIDPKTIQLRAFKGKDEKLIASLTYENFESKFVEILKSVLTGIDPRELTIGDRLYIMLWEVINSYTRFCNLDYQCSNCYQKAQYDVDMSLIQVIELPNGFKEPYPIKLTNGSTLNLRLFRVRDEEEAKDFEKTTGQSAWLYRYALSIVDDKLTDVDRMTVLDEVATQDIALIRAFHERYYHGPKMEAMVECKKCGASEVAPIPFRLELFFPHGDSLKRYFGNAI